MFSDWDHRLHQEIVDFYEYVKPRDFEDRVRQNLIDRIQGVVRLKYPHLLIYAFGSFASGLYLPTADMDLVALSPSFEKYGAASFGTKQRDMWDFARELERAGIIKPGSLTVIPKAKVPIVKFVERITGLRVDISFENDSGLIALRTFDVWKERYPAMPIIVSLIKQFLVMRDLSEVVNGGIGGFTVVCLVVNVIHQLEASKKAVGDLDWRARNNLDMVLLQFLKTYGMNFNLKHTGLNMIKMTNVNKVRRLRMALLLTLVLTT